MIEGLEDEKNVTKFHEWIITTVNDYISSVDDCRTKSLDIADLTDQLKKVTDIISIAIF